MMYGWIIKSLHYNMANVALPQVSTPFLVKPFVSDEICSPLSQALVKLQACAYVRMFMCMKTLISRD